MTTTTTPPDLDLWAGPLNRPLADVIGALTRRPDLYSALGWPVHRAIICGEAARLLAEEPDATLPTDRSPA